MMRYQKIDGHPYLVRDKNSGAILNINREEIQKKKQQRLKSLQKDNEIEILKNDVSEIKNLLQQLLENNKHG
jgi:predicted RNA-binding protein YlxR (DUF448 family)